MVGARIQHQLPVLWLHTNSHAAVPEMDTKTYDHTKLDKHYNSNCDGIDIKNKINNIISACPS